MLDEQPALGLEIVRALEDGAVPDDGNDVWEQAYYLNYVNRRADYVKEIFSLINWQKLEEKNDEAIG